MSKGTKLLFRVYWIIKIVQLIFIGATFLLQVDIKNVHKKSQKCSFVL